jgi:hypothetical protein
LYILGGNDSLSIAPLHEDMFENASIIFNDNGSITLEGDIWQFELEFHDCYPSELNYKVHPNYIDKTRFTKKDIVRSGWHRKLQNSHKKMIIKNYIINYPKTV